MTEDAPPGALAGILVVDFTAHLPGPWATLMLARAGAEVIKIERPGGEPGRADDAVFNLLNRGKRSIEIDLKRDPDLLRPLLERADVVIEQFRPGVMDRLGLGYEEVKRINPRVVYVSINGYGSSGADVHRPGHDLSYQAEAGLLSLNVNGNGEPIFPAAMVADISGGGQAAFANIVLALFRRDRTGEGARIDVPLFDGVLPYLHEAIAHHKSGMSVHPGYSPATGSSPRYNLYRTADGRWLALASPEEKFWLAFCEKAGLPVDADKCAVSARLAERSADEWLMLFADADLCCSLVVTVEEALESPRVRSRLEQDSLPLPLSMELTRGDELAPAPDLGEGGECLLGLWSNRID